jgi:rhodanese-related sulfurtransferase
MAEPISPQELKDLMAGDRKPCLLDVRRKADYESSPAKIGEAGWNDPEKVDQWIDEIPKDQPVVLYCVKGGSVSQSISDRLEKTHPDVRFLQGGIKAWTELGEEVAE